MRTREIQAGINRTIKLLDSKIPKWRRLIDKDNLDIGDCYRCVTAHVFGCYDKGLQELGLSHYDAEYYGLALDIEPDDENRFVKEYNRLTQLWLRSINTEQLNS